MEFGGRYELVILVVFIFLQMKVHAGVVQKDYGTPNIEDYPLNDAPLEDSNYPVESIDCFNTVQDIRPLLDGACWDLEWEYVKDLKKQNRETSRKLKAENKECKEGNFDWVYEYDEKLPSYCRYPGEFRPPNQCTRSLCTYPESDERVQWHHTREQSGRCIVSDRYKLVWFYNPKAAIGSNERLMKNVLNGTVSYWDDLSPKQQLYYTFAVVREPLDRVLSAFNQINQIPGRGEGNEFFKKKTPKRRFSTFLKETEDNNWHKGLLGANDWDEHFIEQLLFLVDVEGNPLPIDLLVTLNQLDDAWVFLRWHLGLPKTVKNVPRRNTGNYTKPDHEHLNIFVDDLLNKHKEAINRIYISDFECFGFEQISVNS